MDTVVNKHGVCGGLDTAVPTTQREEKNKYMTVVKLVTMVVLRRRTLNGKRSAFSSCFML